MELLLNTSSTFLIYRNDHGVLCYFPCYNISKVEITYKIEVLGLEKTLERFLECKVENAILAYDYLDGPPILTISFDVEKTHEGKCGRGTYQMVCIVQSTRQPIGMQIPEVEVNTGYIVEYEEKLETICPASCKTKLPDRLKEIMDDTEATKKFFQSFLFLYDPIEDIKQKRKK